MSKLISIPDSFYTEAAANIAAERMKNESNVVPQHIEQQLRSYVYLGVNKKIVDWSSLLSDGDKDQLLKAIIARTQDYYSYTSDYGKSYTNMEILENLAYQGLASPNIARPRAAQEAYEAQLVDAHKNDVGVLEQGIQNFFGVVKAGIESILKGLGINIPIEAILGLVALVVLVILFRPVRGA